MTEQDDLLVFNGIDATTGQYSLRPMKPEEFSAGILGQPAADPDAEALRNWHEYRQQDNYAIKEGHDPRKLAETGWGVVFPANTNPAIVDALRPLMDWRKAQAAAEHEHYYKEYTGGQGGVRPNDTKGTWLARQGAENYGPVDPENVPYYLLLVGSPQEIDYRFQYMLDVQYAVGRIYFETVEEYANYAKSVVEAEKQQLKLPRKVGFFGVANPDDAATNMSANNLIMPLAQYVSDEKLKDAQPWHVQAVLRDEATKQRLADFLGGKDTPAVLLTASHGMSFPNGNPKQLRHSGSLLCQDWPGPRQWKQPIPEDFYFSADDLASDAKLWGTIAFFFACYGAGTPMYDEFTKQAFKDQRAQIAPNAFISQLPMRLLSHPKGGALAVIGHVERAWGYSFVYGKGRSLTAFESTLDALQTNAPVGYAFDYFNTRFAEFSTELTQTLQDAEWTTVDPLELANKWTANNDAKNYVVLGDPAVRAPVADETPAADKVFERPSITLTEISPSAEAHFAAEGVAVVTEVKTTVDGAMVEAQVGVTATTAVVVPGGGGGAVEDEASFGLKEDFQQLTGNVGSSLQQFAQKLGTFLSAALENATTLQISTYTSQEMANVSIQGNTVVGAELRALTAISVDGDTKQVVPVDEDGAVDSALWALHMETVKQAQESRAQLIQAAISAVTNLVNMGGGK